MTIAVITVPLLIIGLIFLIIFIYRIIYKQNMNRALEGRATTGLIEIGPLLKTITFIALIIMNIVALTKIEDLTWQLRNLESNLTNQINFLRSEMNSISSDMEDYYQSLELVQDVSKEFKSADLSEDEYTFTVQFTLRELDPTANVYLIVEHEGTSDKYPLTSDTLTFSKDITLDYSKIEYEIKVLIEGTTLVQEDVTDIQVEYYAESAIGFYSGLGESQDKLLVFAYVLEDIDLDDGVDVQKVEFKIIQDGTVVKTETVTSTTTLDALLSPYEDFEFWEYQKGTNTEPVFAISYELNDFYEVEFEYTITLTDGSVIEREMYGY